MFARFSSKVLGAMTAAKCNDECPTPSVSTEEPGSADETRSTSADSTSTLASDEAGGTLEEPAKGHAAQDGARAEERPTNEASEDLHSNASCGDPPVGPASPQMEVAVTEASPSIPPVHFPPCRHR